MKPQTSLYWKLRRKGWNSYEAREYVRDTMEAKQWY